LGNEKLFYFGKTTDWKYIVNFYENDRGLKNRMAPKLCKSHVEPTKFERMRVKYATQVLSATVAAALETYVNLNALPKEALGTTEFVRHFNNLFDMFNSSKLYNKKVYNRPFSGTDIQLKFLDETLTLLKSMRVFNGKQKDITKARILGFLPF
jgi:hypothetical protein